MVDHKITLLGWGREGGKREEGGVEEAEKKEDGMKGRSRGREDCK